MVEVGRRRPHSENRLIALTMNPGRFDDNVLDQVVGNGRRPVTGFSIALHVMRVRMKMRRLTGG